MQLNSPEISVVVPVYKCCDCLFELYNRLASVLSSLSVAFEIVLVNDASPDESWDVISQLAASDSRVKGISLSRNFGQHQAITAGLLQSHGKWVVVMDCDLQDMPEEIARLYATAQAGYKVVVGKRKVRQDSVVKKVLSRFFYIVFNNLSDIKFNRNLTNFGIYHRMVIDSILACKEQSRSFGLLALWVGFRRIEIDVEHSRRTRGKSSYSFMRMVGLAIDSIIAHSNKLLVLTVKFGLSMSLLSVFGIIWFVARYILHGTTVAGWTSLIISIFFVAGLIVGCIGVVGLYVGKIFDEVKQRPHYIIETTTGRGVDDDK